MTELLTASQMRALEKAAMDSGDCSGVDLMEAAGAGVVDTMLATWPALAQKAHAACVLTGPGNNGGDGFVIARLLAARGWTVRVHLFGDPAKLPPDAKVNYDRWVEYNDVFPLTVQAVQNGERPDVIVDAVFGIGLTRALPEELAQVLDSRVAKVWKRAHTIRRVAVDCPSGLDLDRGSVPADLDTDAEDPDPRPKTVNSADLTVTFHAPKPGHFLGVGPTLCGKVEVVDIGVGSYGPERTMLGLPPDPERLRLIDPVFLGAPLKPKMWPMSHIAKSQGAGHKYNHGHVAVLSGGVGRGGAARMAAR